jgi:hypothetical protein
MLQLNRQAIIALRRIMEGPTTLQPHMKSALMLLALSISLITANAAPKPPTPITSLPITITAPGSYYFISDMFYTPTSLTESTAITINAPGEVTINLKGFALTCPLQVFAGGFYLNPTGILIKSSNVTIKNGTIKGFSKQLITYQNPDGPDIYFSNIDIQSVTFNGGLYNSIQFYFVNNSIVRDCSFNTPAPTAIIGGRSQTGNSYINDTFNGSLVNPIAMESDTPIVVHRITPLKQGDKD